MCRWMSPCPGAPLVTAMRFCPALNPGEASAKRNRPERWTSAGIPIMHANAWQKAHEPVQGLPVRIVVRDHKHLVRCHVRVLPGRWHADMFDLAGATDSPTVPPRWHRWQTGESPATSRMRNLFRSPRRETDHNLVSCWRREGRGLDSLMSHAGIGHGRRSAARDSRRQAAPSPISVSTLVARQLVAGRPLDGGVPMTGRRRPPGRRTGR